jgi:hypothetical protein
LKESAKELKEDPENAISDDLETPNFQNFYKLPTPLGWVTTFCQESMIVLIYGCE